jgi:hypothetical protein
MDDPSGPEAVAAMVPQGMRTMTDFVTLCRSGYQWTTGVYHSDPHSMGITSDRAYYRSYSGAYKAARKLAKARGEGLIYDYTGDKLIRRYVKLDSAA